jgi:gamma-glutamylcyclotransferase (GGCT)/AIG2-like uncharacterized protein YtfP
MIRLFSYGTLQQRSVQVASFGHELSGHADALPGYVRRMVTIDDPEVVRLSGAAQHPNVEPSDQSDDSVPGMVFEITEAELVAADRYEHAGGYHRVAVTLASGVQAWVYRR